MKELTLTDGVWGKKYNHTFVKYACVVLTANLIGIAYYVHSFIELGYLPSPFIYDKSDTFMDFFNVLYWAYDSGRYTDWGSIYPPLSFFIVKFINFVANGASSGDPDLIRGSSPIVICVIILIYLSIPLGVVNMRRWRMFSILEKLILYLIIVTSVPMLFAFERGNLILLTPILLALVLERIGWVRVLGLATLINIKPYFVILLYYYIARNSLSGFIRSVMASGLIFFITGLALDQNFLIFFRNIFSFAQDNNVFSLREIMALPSSISSFSVVLVHPNAEGFLSNYLNSQLANLIVFAIEVSKWCTIALALLISYVASHKLRDAEILAIILVVITNLGVWVGGYTVIFYVALIPGIFKLRYRNIYLFIMALMSLSLDSIPVISEDIGIQYSYFCDCYVPVQWVLGVGAVFRPFINYLLLIILIFEFGSRCMSFQQGEVRSIRAIIFKLSKGTPHAN